jgi:hypothetical protein
MPGALGAIGAKITKWSTIAAAGSCRHRGDELPQSFGVAAELMMRFTAASAWG